MSGIKKILTPLILIVASTGASSLLAYDSLNSTSTVSQIHAVACAVYCDGVTHILDKTVGNTGYCQTYNTAGMAALKASLNNGALGTITTGANSVIGAKQAAQADRGVMQGMLVQLNNIANSDGLKACPVTTFPALSPTCTNTCPNN